MSAPPDVEHDIADHLCRWSRTGRDGACLDRYRMRRQTDRQAPTCTNVVAAIGLGAFVVPADLLDQHRSRRRSEIAAPGTTTKSP